MRRGPSKQVADDVAVGEELVEIETDKANMGEPSPSPSSGSPETAKGQVEIVEHQTAAGADGAEFLAAIKRILQEPLALSL